MMMYQVTLYENKPALKVLYPQTPNTTIQHAFGVFVGNVSVSKHQWYDVALTQEALSAEVDELLVHTAFVVFAKPSLLQGPPELVKEFITQFTIAYLHEYFEFQVEWFGVEGHKQPLLRATHKFTTTKGYRRFSCMDGRVHLIQWCLKEDDENESWGDHLDTLVNYATNHPEKIKGDPEVIQAFFQQKTGLGCAKL